MRFMPFAIELPGLQCDKLIILFMGMRVKHPTGGKSFMGMG